MNDETITQQVNYNKNSEPSHEQVKSVIECRLNQKQQLLNHIKKFGSVSTIEAYAMRILSPSAAISKLKSEGHSIVSTKDWNKNGMAVYFFAKRGDSHEE